MVDDRVELLSRPAEEEEKHHSPLSETNLNTSAAETISFPETCERRLQTADRYDIIVTSHCDITNNSLNVSSESEQNKMHFTKKHAIRSSHCSSNRVEM